MSLNPKGHAIKAFQEHDSQTVHELLEQYILTLVPAGMARGKLLQLKQVITMCLKEGF
ncbi:hypothetical protein MTR_1g085380 [Medicago truncatula]|uniref:Uncharacterized protein n=1 Tax=Medicago truncatula TaxID=3880 RepID=G7IBP2_MEDTR|nr:hypothetical protein MTR_1g085380 [Medicago truncatula]